MNTPPYNDSEQVQLDLPRITPSSQDPRKGARRPDIRILEVIARIPFQYAVRSMTVKPCVNLPDTVSNARHDRVLRLFFSVSKAQINPWTPDSILPDIFRESRKPYGGRRGCHAGKNIGLMCRPE